MFTAFSRPLPRTMLAATLALFGTVMSFAGTATPALANAPGYKATLVSSLEAPAKKVVNGSVWKCAGSDCAGSDNGSRALTNCAKMVKAFGPVASFTGPRGELSADDLARCNAAD